MKDNENEIGLTGRGVVLITFFTDKQGAKKVMYYKNLFLQQAERHGMTAEKFTQYSKQSLSPMMSFHTAVLQYLGTDKKRITQFVSWLFEEGYLNNADVMAAFNAKVAEPPVRSKNFQPVSNLNELKSKHSTWVEIKSAPGDHDFLVTICFHGQEFTYPEPMQLEEACSCVNWLIERHKLPWDAVFIPTSEIVKQADKSLTCRRVLKEMQQEGLRV